MGIIQGFTSWIAAHPVYVAIGAAWMIYELLRDRSRKDDTGELMYPEDEE